MGRRGRMRDGGGRREVAVQPMEVERLEVQPDADVRGEETAHDVVAVDAERVELEPHDEQVPGVSVGYGTGASIATRGRSRSRSAYHAATRLRAATNSSRRASCAIPRAACRSVRLYL